MTKIDECILQDLRQVRWFEKCTQVSPIFEFEVSQVPNWQKAKKIYESSLWDDLTQDAQGRLSEFLFKKHNNIYNSSWNKLAKQASGFFDMEILPLVEGFAQNHELGNLFIQCVSWDIQHIIIEKSFVKQKPPIFFGLLFTVYKAGHFPCGWNGKWPKGKMLIV